MEFITDLDDLPKYLNKIEKIFNINSMTSEIIDADKIIDYYEESEVGYKFLHSPEGSIHMAINYDGVFNKNGYLEQAKKVDSIIKNNGIKHVLELGCGKGFNSKFLAEHNPNVTFTGVDLSPSHIKAAKDSTSQLNNIFFLNEDFQNLPFDTDSFELVFEVESICHALDMPKALSETFRVLKNNGTFILFDGFRKNNFNELPANLRLAAKLTEISMAWGKPLIIDDFINIAKDTGFGILDVSDISHAIMPNLKRLQVMARGFYKYPSLANVLKKILPAHLLKNSIAGVLMPITIKNDAQGYYLIEMKKR